jgi:hypothetical protein
MNIFGRRNELNESRPAQTMAAMNRFRVIGPLLLVAAALGAALWWSARPNGFATPQKCVETYRDALVSGNGEAYLNCLAEPLRSEMRGRLTDPALRRSAEGLKGWTQLEPEIDGARASIFVDEIRTMETCRTRFRLERSGQGWLIVGIDAPRILPQTVPYGTHVGKTEGPPPKEADDP